MISHIDFSHDIYIITIRGYLVNVSQKTWTSARELFFPVLPPSNRQGLFRFLVQIELCRQKCQTVFIYKPFRPCFVCYTTVDLI